MMGNPHCYVSLPKCILQICRSIMAIDGAYSDPSFGDTLAEIQVDRLEVDSENSHIWNVCPHWNVESERNETIKLPGERSSADDDDGDDDDDDDDDDAAAADDSPWQAPEYQTISWFTWEQTPINLNTNQPTTTTTTTTPYLHSRHRKHRFPPPPSNWAETPAWLLSDESPRSPAAVKPWTIWVLI